MHRKQLLELIAKHQAFDENELEMTKKTIEFVNDNPDCFKRELLEGHITASSWIIDLRTGQSLLTHHNKLNKWLQLGGHCDGDSDVLAVALKEAQEESGLKNFKPIANWIFDIDVHTIPEHKGVPEHLHYDIRFLFEADSEEKLVVSSESKALKWCEMAMLPMMVKDESMLRMVRKAKFVLDME